MKIALASIIFMLMGLAVLIGQTKQSLTRSTVPTTSSGYTVDLPEEVEAISTDPKKPDLATLYRVGNKIYIGFYQNQCRGEKKDGSRCRQTMLIQGTGRCRYHQKREGEYQCSSAGCTKSVAKRGDLCTNHEN